LIPVIGGLVVRLLLPKVVALITPVLPWISVLAISSIVGIVVGGNRDNIITAGGVVLVAVIIHNGLGYLLGYLTGKVTRQSEPVSRTMAIEVGMQNSGMATTLATTYFSPLSALPGAVCSVWHNLSGAVVAAVCGYVDGRAKKAEEAVAAQQLLRRYPFVQWCMTGRGGGIKMASMTVWKYVLMYLDDFLEKY